MPLQIRKVNRLEHPRKKRYGWLLFGMFTKRPDNKMEYSYHLEYCKDDIEIKNIAKKYRGLHPTQIRNYGLDEELAVKTAHDTFEEWELSMKLKREMARYNAHPGEI